MHGEATTCRRPFFCGLTHKKKNNNKNLMIYQRIHWALHSKVKGENLFIITHLALCAVRDFSAFLTGNL